jgi:23S rRNA (pseudouridine1915-N3)-methyltransferase
VTEIAEASGPPAELKRRENAAIRAALPSKAHVVALDPGGVSPDSAGFAHLLATWQSQQAPLYFLIGGAEGLDATTLAGCAATISLGPLTWPHMMCRVLLAEQLYRAQSILAGHPYHRAGRPAPRPPPADRPPPGRYTKP